MLADAGKFVNGPAFFADLAGVGIPDGLSIDGVSLAPEIYGGSSQQETVDRMLFTSHFHNSQRPGEQVIFPFPASVLFGQWSAVRENQGDWRLFDLGNDPGQTIDLSDSAPEVLQPMVEAYDLYYADVTSDGFTHLPAEAGHETHGIVHLPAHEAIIRGDAFAYAHKWGWAHDWLSSTGERDGTAEWPLRVVRAGSYRITVGYAAPSESKAVSVELNVAGSSSLLELDHHITRPLPGRRVYETGEAVDMQWATSKPVDVELAPGDYRITVAPGAELTKGDLLVKHINIEALSDDEALHTFRCEHSGVTPAP